ncbi:MurR/RpiR family transcriptional regulator [Paracoccus cavernae]|uniref:MurR/RpiR family transcriptional regulator n=1 Tax=Paracoccus cavernae TaxID=1571207 RepID=UPI003642C0A0
MREKDPIPDPQPDQKDDVEGVAAGADMPENHTEAGVENGAPVSGAIEDRLRRHFGQLTPSERLLADHLTRNFPVAGLGSMTLLAKEAGVSTPTVLRMVQKLGFRGYPEFQAQLRDEVEARLESPLSKQARWTGGAPQTHILNRFADAVLANLTRTLGQIDHADFDACAALLADPDRRIIVTGGRITHPLADYLVTQLGIVRPGWPLCRATPIPGLRSCSRCGAAMFSSFSTSAVTRPRRCNWRKWRRSRGPRSCF